MDFITKAFLTAVNAVKGPQIHELKVQAARDVLAKAQSRALLQMPADIEDREIPCDPRGRVSIRIVRPKGNKLKLPVIMYFHGGGWVLGDKHTHDRLLREIACRTQAAVVFVNFTLAPEAQYPVSLEEAFAATRYIAENCESFNFDALNFAVAGDSAGANLAAAVTMMAKERGGLGIVFQLLFYPVTDADFETSSYKQFAAKYYLTRDAMKWFWQQYLPDHKRRKESNASPLRATLDQLRNLPPALIITAEYDVLRDEGEAYANRLMEAGVEVAAVRYLGIIHDFVMLNALAETPPARSAMDLAVSSLKRAFCNAEAYLDLPGFAPQCAERSVPVEL